MSAFGSPVDDAEALALLRGQPRRVVLVGNYGSVNLGDELLLAVVAGWVREAGGEPVAISVSPAHTERVHGVPAIDYADAAAIARVMAEADLLVLGGGGLLQDYNVLDEDALAHFPAFEATQFAQHTLLAATLGLPYCALAQGVGPLRSATSRRLARHVFASANAASVRDDGSAALLRDIGCDLAWPVAPDPGWTWQPAPSEPLPAASVDAALAGKRVLALLLRDWPYDARWEERFVAAFGPALPSGWACLWLDFHRDPMPCVGSPSPSAIAARMRERLPGVHAIWQGETLEEAYRLLAGCDAALAMRLHGVLLAHRAGLPTATLEYDAKVGALAAELGMPPAQRVPLDAIGERLPAAVATVTGRGNAPPFRLDATAIATQAERALRHRSLLWQAMAGTAARPPEGARRRWLAAWARDDTASAPGYVDALEGRLHRMLDQQQVVAGDLARALAGAKHASDELGRAVAALGQARAELAQAREERADVAAALAREARLRETAQEEATEVRGRLEAIERSHAYRLFAPAMRLPAAVASWRRDRRGGRAP